jgi:hypothetical protein
MGVDTSTAAVKRLASFVYFDAEDADAIKDTLRALAAERDAALARAETAEREGDALLKALRSIAGIAAVPWMDCIAQRLRIWKDARAALATPVQEARQ